MYLYRSSSADGRIVRSPLHLTWKKRHRKILHSARFLALQVGRVRENGRVEEAGRGKSSRSELANDYCIASIAGLERGDRIQKFTESKKLNAPHSDRHSVQQLASRWHWLYRRYCACVIPLFAPQSGDSCLLRLEGPGLEALRANPGGVGRLRAVTGGLKCSPKRGASESTNAKNASTYSPLVGVEPATIRLQNVNLYR
ncbi:hypothetical protein EVAR_99178_1 [Eumeta japonica]|uniref:Uncharacterized protein n=1 Tax=Eumeta variegata TaxID=151549 RepID=A0A4C1YTE9_EUMVA|nr:hypothetical protein EVAR_99178_1 [Eumeta japonica]